MKSTSQNTLTKQTIQDFGEQWTAFTENEGYYASSQLFQDILSPLLKPQDLKGKRVADIGSGTGRIVNMLCDAGVTAVVALEPSNAYPALLRNTQAHHSKITFVHEVGENLPATGDLDYVFSIGVLHHIPDPLPVARAAYGALKREGHFFVWLYAYEGNETILWFLLPLRALTRRLPHQLLVALVWILDIPVRLYTFACRYLPLPMRHYFTEVLGRFDTKVRRLTLYDQLNPAYAKYYRKGEAEKLLREAGFSDIRLNHRHGYSWSVLGIKK